MLRWEIILTHGRVYRQITMRVFHIGDRFRQNVVLNLGMDPS